MPTSSYPAELYALLHRGNPGDLAFYREQCRGAGSVLELGCGYGRLFEPLADVVGQIVGLERDAGLLALARGERRLLRADAIELIQADMRSFALARAFDRVLIPYCGLYCMLSPEDCLRALRCAAAHLNPDGLLIFDAYPADHYHHQGAKDIDDSDAFEPLLSLVHRGAVFDVLEKSSWDRSRQRIDVVYRYRSREDGSLIEGAIAQRYLIREQIEPLLAAAGMRLRALHGDFEGGAFNDDAEVLVVIAERD